MCLDESTCKHSVDKNHFVKAVKVFFFVYITSCKHWEGFGRIVESYATP